jgi:hypothetical protein
VLHATIHQKLDPSVPEPHRIEDALTSSVFGTLALVGAWSLLAQWLGVRSANVLPKGCHVWFWPRLRYAEPDVILRLGQRLIVVEAKYRSGKHDLSDPSLTIRDQIHRQVESLQVLARDRDCASPELAAAASACETTFLMVVDGRRMARALREFNESKQRVPAETDLRLVTWQALYPLLVASEAYWAAELRRYLDLTGLAAFLGIPAGLSKPTRDLSQGWSHSGLAPARLSAGLPAPGAACAHLESWRGQARSGSGGFGVLSPDSIPIMKSLLSFKFTPCHERS